MIHVCGHYFITPLSLTLPVAIPMGVCTGHLAAVVFTFSGSLAEKQYWLDKVMTLYVLQRIVACTNILCILRGILTSLPGVWVKYLSF
jgi:hypothetical protein